MGKLSTYFRGRAGTGPSRLLLWVFLALSAFAVTTAQSADLLTKSANDLFRTGNYEEALVQYLAAQEAGDDSPLLHYNTGVTYYKLERYEDAERELLRAAAEPKLTAAAHYNLGLAAGARGNKSEARKWFESASNTGSRGIESLARKALVRLGKPPKREQMRRDYRWYGTKKEKPGTFNFFAVSKIGTNDNIYRAPDSDYVDISLPGAPTIMPEAQSGTFAEVNMRAEYSYFGIQQTLFRFGYYFDGEFYTDSQYSNANEWKHRVSIGGDTPLGGKKGRKRTLKTAFIVSEHRETNFDPDDGVDRQINGEDISDRFEYRGFGPKAKYIHEFGPFEADVGVRAELRSYNDPMVVPSYSHAYYRANTHLTYRWSPAMSFRLGLTHARRDYEDRVSRDLNGDLLSTSPELELRYNSAGLTVRRKLGRQALVRAEYLFTLRDDRFEGYDDYERHSAKLAAEWRPVGRLRTLISIAYRDYHYKNAFAFNDPTSVERDLEVFEAELRLQYKLTKRWTLWGEIEIDDHTASDPRAEYARTRATIGAKWTL